MTNIIELKSAVFSDIGPNDKYFAARSFSSDLIDEVQTRKGLICVSNMAMILVNKNNYIIVSTQTLKAEASLKLRLDHMEGKKDEYGNEYGSLDYQYIAIIYLEQQNILDHDIDKILDQLLFEEETGRFVTDTDSSSVSAFIRNHYHASELVDLKLDDLIAKINSYGYVLKNKY